MWQNQFYGAPQQHLGSSLDPLHYMDSAFVATQHNAITPSYQASSLPMIDLGEVARKSLRLVLLCSLMARSDQFSFSAPKPSPRTTRPRATPVRRAPPRRSTKRAREDSDTDSDYTPSKRQAPSKRQKRTSDEQEQDEEKLPPLPPHLQPIRVDATRGLRCPLPGCPAILDSKDSTWRGHFKRAHHNELCGCGGRPKKHCKASCPFPCLNNCGGIMGLECVGRHWLNLHIGVEYICPVCLRQETERHSSCSRHIRDCIKKQKLKEEAAAAAEAEAEAERQVEAEAEAERQAEAETERQARQAKQTRQKKQKKQ